MHADEGIVLSPPAGVQQREVLEVHRPTVVPTPRAATWITVPSWRLEPSPIRMPGPSPRSTAPNQMPQLAPISTPPISVALGAMKAEAGPGQNAVEGHDQAGHRASPIQKRRAPCGALEVAEASA